MQAGRLNIDESRAQEITTHLRPIPNLTLTGDRIDPISGGPAQGAFAYFLPLSSVNWLYGRDQKRPLRRESSQQATAIAVSSQADLKRNLLSSLRRAFVDTWQAKPVLGPARESLSYYDHVLDVSRERFQAGDIARIDLNRLEFERGQCESYLQTAEVNLRTPVEPFDITGTFNFTDQLPPLDDFCKIAVDTRPHPRAATQSVGKAGTDDRLAVADRTTDPIFGSDVGRNPPIDAYFGVSVSIPSKIFDRNQGEKGRTRLNIDRRQRLRDAIRAQVLSDVDSSYAVLSSNLTLLQPYKIKYLEQAVRMQNTGAFSYKHDGAPLLEFLNAPSEYRTVQLSYLNLVGSYLTAASQLNLAVGREVIP